MMGVFVLSENAAKSLRNQVKEKLCTERSPYWGVPIVEVEGLPDNEAIIMDSVEQANSFRMCFQGLVKYANKTPEDASIMAQNIVKAFYI